MDDRSYHQKKCERQALVINQLARKLAKAEAELACERLLRRDNWIWGARQTDVAERPYHAVKEALSSLPVEERQRIQIKHRVYGKYVQNALERERL